jgi:hypothetical protein
MEPDTTTPGDRPAPEERDKGKILRFGLNTGQTIIVLTTEPVDNDFGTLVIQASSGDVITIQEEAIVWTRKSEVDMPTPEEISAYEERLKGQQPSNLDNPLSADMLRQLSGGYI